MKSAFGGVFLGRRVLVTGHTGFKGAWLCEWLLALGAEVAGYSLAPNTNPNLSSMLGHPARLLYRLGDICNPDELLPIFQEFQPEIVFHLAAQPLVRQSYRDPVDTWRTNVLGTIQVLEAIRCCRSAAACVAVTTDKCYENREWPWGYRETDQLGGHDPYSSSKGAAELAVASWRRSFFQEPKACRLATARAGNVIGGGDWSADRLVVDFISTISSNGTLRLRNPNATRPWQHVLEPLSGYLWLAAKLLGADGGTYAEAWNLGPEGTSVCTVAKLAQLLIHSWGSGSLDTSGDPEQPHEAGLLKLDVSKAIHHLRWRGIWDLQKTVDETVAWYKRQIGSCTDPADFTRSQIASYLLKARQEELPWAGAIES